MRNKQQPYQMGKAIEYNEEPELSDLIHFDKSQHSPTNREGGFRAGTINTGTGVHMEEGEEPGSIADMSNEQVRNSAVEEFSNKMKQAVSAKLMGRKTNIKLKGHPDLIKQITNMIKMEADYLDAMISGQSADTPALQKNKAIIDMEAKKLDRMLGADGVWPFK